MNWTLEDFYAGKVAVEYDKYENKLSDLNRLLSNSNFLGINKYYYCYDPGLYQGTSAITIPSAPLSYFISLLDAAEKNAQKAALISSEQPEYIYEPFSEEAAKNGAVVVTANKKIEVKFIYYHDGIMCVINGGDLQVWPCDEFKIRRPIEKKEVECYVYEDGHISSIQVTGMNLHGKIISTFTHTIKIPKK